MANLNWKGSTFKLDSSTGSLSDLTAYTNSVEVAGSQELLEDTSLNDEEFSYVTGLAGATITANLFGNSTTDNIFGPLVGNRTSISKTMRYYDRTKWYAGEVFLSEVTKSGAPNTLQMWAISGTFDGPASNTTT